jgi:DNA-binding cell septation regulator SpoVG
MDGTPLWNGKRPEDFTETEALLFTLETETILNGKENLTMAKIDPHSDAAHEVSDQAEFLMTAPIADVAKAYNRSIDEAVALRVAAAIASAPPKLDVTVRPIEPKGNLIGYATLKLNDSFVVEDFKVLQSEKGIFVGMPSKKDEKSQTGYRDTAKPITKEFRAALTEAVTAEYHKAVERLQARAAEQKQPIKKQLENGAKQAAQHNAKAPPAKGGKDKSAEI